MLHVHMIVVTLFFDFTRYMVVKPQAVHSLNLDGGVFASVSRAKTQFQTRKNRMRTGLNELYQTLYNHETYSQKVLFSDRIWIHFLKMPLRAISLS